MSLVAVGIATLAIVATARAGGLHVDGCGSYGAGPFAGSSQTGLLTPNTCPGGALQLRTSGTAVAGARASWQTTAPAGIRIDHFWIGNGSLEVGDINSGLSYGGGFFWQRGGAQATAGETGYSSPNDLSTSYIGWQMVCGRSTCTTDSGAFLHVYQVQVLATENSGPTIIATTPLWYTSGWIRGSWPLAFVTSDPSGTCDVRAALAGQTVQGPTAAADHTRWHQCPDLAFSQWINTSAYPAGAQPLAIQAENAANVWTGAAKTQQIDNVTPTISLSRPDNGDWIGHGASISATASAGPSGVASISCSVDGQTAQSWPSAAAQAAVDGTGVHRIVCWSANGAHDASGRVAESAPATRTVKIDETPPEMVAFEARNPADPQQLVVDTADRESGVTTGAVQIRPVGGQWQPLATQFDGQHLLARFSDAHLHGDYQFQATACDAVGNCSTTIETLAMPLRIASVSDVSFTQLETPAACRSVRERVLVGWHWARLRVNGQLVLVKRGGKPRVIMVTRCRRSCTYKQVRIHGRSRVQSGCAQPRIVVRSTKRVGFGRSVAIHGVVMTTQGAPLAGQVVRILSAPDNGHGSFSQAATARTAADGEWWARVSAGPSRLIRAVYDGSSMLLPSMGVAKTVVPAAVRLRISPQATHWGRTIAISGRLLGGYIPPAGEVLFLRLRYNGKQIEVQHVRTAHDGRFHTSYTFLGGSGSASYPFWATTVPESDYPYAAGNSRRIAVTVGP